MGPTVNPKNTSGFREALGPTVNLSKKLPKHATNAKAMGPSSANAKSSWGPVKIAPGRRKQVGPQFGKMNGFNETTLHRKLANQVPHGSCLGNNPKKTYEDHGPTHDNVEPLS